MPFILFIKHLLKTYLKSYFKDIDHLSQLADRLKNQSETATTLAQAVFKNATNILETLEKFDQFVADGKEKMRKAEGLRTLTEENIKNSQTSLRHVQDKLRSLNAHLEDLKRITTKSNSILNDANNVMIKFISHFIILKFI